MSSSEWKQGHWTHTYDDDSMKSSLDIQGLVSDMMEQMREKEDDVLEPIIVEWLQSRGFTVTKEGEDDAN